MRALSSLPAFGLLAALLVPAAAPRAEDGFSPIIVRDLGEPDCGINDDVQGVALAEGGEDGASPAGGALLDPPVPRACHAGRDPLLPTGWEAWAGWTPLAGEAGGAADGPPDAPPGRLESRAGVSATEFPTGSYAAPIWAGTFAGYGDASRTRERGTPQLGTGVSEPGAGTGTGTGTGAGTGSGPDQGQDGEEEAVVLPVDDPSLLQVETPPVVVTSATIPEPGSMVLFATGLTALALLRRRGAPLPG